MKPIEDTGSEAVVEPVPVSSVVETAVDSSAESGPRLALHPLHRGYGLLAASVAIAAVFGAVIGSAATGAFSKPAALNVADVEKDTVDCQQSVARLSLEEYTSLKASLRPRTSRRKVRSRRSANASTVSAPRSPGSITPPQTMPASAAPLPMPRPTSADADPQPPAKVSIVTNWSIRRRPRRLRLCAGSRQHL